jgi:hypothetical protein
MVEQELQQALDTLASGDIWAQIKAVHQLGRSGDARAVTAVLDFLTDRDCYHSEVQRMAAEGFVEGAPGTVELLIERYLAAPSTPAAWACANALGVLGSRQGALRDARIVPVLLEGLAAAASLGSVASLSAVSALRECARAAPVPEAVPWLWRLLEKASEEKEPYDGCLRKAIQLLWIAEGSAILPRLSGLRSTVGEDHPLALEIEWFLEKPGTTAI